VDVDLAVRGWRGGLPGPRPWCDAGRLRRRNRHRQPFDRSHYGDRKRNSASALYWIKLTQGEHVFAPHRKSPTAYRPCSIQDRGLAIDRTWWRIHRDLPGRHYPDLDRTCTRYAESLAAQIDHANVAAA
jgi:hypothetical protein